MGLTQSCDRRPVFYFIGDSITEYGSDPDKSGFITILQHHYVRAIDCVNRGLSGYNTKFVDLRNLLFVWITTINIFLDKVDTYWF